MAAVGFVPRVVAVKFIGTAEPPARLHPAPVSWMNRRPGTAESKVGTRVQVPEMMLPGFAVMTLVGVADRRYQSPFPKFTEGVTTMLIHWSVWPAPEVLGVTAPQPGDDVAEDQAVVGPTAASFVVVIVNWALCPAPGLVPRVPAFLRGKMCRPVETVQPAPASILWCQK